MEKELEPSAEAAPGRVPRLKVTMDTAKVYKLRGDEGGGWFTWAVIIIRSWKGGGSIDVQSDYGNYAYIWSSIGDADIREFLCNVGYDYFMSKAHHTRGYVTDWDKTADELKRMALESRRSGDLDADDAREIFDALEAIDRDEGFYWQARDYPALSKFVSRQEWPKRVEREAQCNGFWERIWPTLRQAWTDELKAERSDARSSSSGPHPSHPIPAPSKGEAG
jgi:hypothetical protein